MDATQHIARANMAILEQGIGLLGSLSDDLYARSSPPAFPRGVGPHLRHCLDHIANFLDGREAGRIDYDLRARETAVETNRGVALERMGELARRLAGVREDEADRAVLVKMDEGGEGTGDRNWSRSTVKRELQFLLSHTIHHYALIAALLRADGIEPPEGFGVAPSTLRHENRLPCAR